VAVQHELGAFAPQHLPQCRPVRQRLAPADRAVGHRVMQQDDANASRFALDGENLSEPLQLHGTDPAAREERRRRPRRAEADQGHGADAMDEWPAVTGTRESREPTESLLLGNPHERIVIARHQADARRRRERFEPERRAAEFFRQRKIGGVAGDDDMIGAQNPHIRLQRFEDFGPVQRAPATPGPAAELTLRQPLQWRQHGFERQMQVGDMRQRDRTHR
jgi:hypothetical protein